jgi:hypothetical protein
LCQRCDCNGHSTQCDSAYGACINCQHNTEDKFFKFDPNLFDNLLISHFYVTIVNVVPQALLEMLAVELRMIVNQHKLVRHANATITVLEDATLSVGA